MRAKITASMKKMDASLTLIATKFANGEYDCPESLNKALSSVNVAKTNASKAYAFLAGAARKGRAGIASMATEEFDETMTEVQQAQVKADLMAVAMKAELDQMEENKVTEEIQPLDLEDGAAPAPAPVAAAPKAAAPKAVEIDDKGAGIKLEEETIETTDLNALSEENDFLDTGLNELGEPVSEDIDILGMGEDGEDSVFGPEGEDLDPAAPAPVAAVAKASPAVLKAAQTAALKASVQRGQRTEAANSLEGCWAFSV